MSLLISCSTSLSTRAMEKKSEGLYGYSEKNPIKVGGAMQGEGPAREREYLNSLTGMNGESVSFFRLGSCCPFETENSGMGMGMLDRYSVTYEGKEDTVVLYINMYDEDVQYAPEGFKFKF
ncbi:MAG: 2-dehydro-3-deoxyphosphooctonate aldolase [Flavobacteriaceae bacterium]|nr:2-dehydro-3-deoxyphosphooctonate aldolase [Flavobacteriaceae bacterium]